MAHLSPLPPDLSHPLSPPGLPRAVSSAWSTQSLSPMALRVHWGRDMMCSVQYLGTHMASGTDSCSVSGGQREKEGNEREREKERGRAEDKMGLVNCYQESRGPAHPKE